MVRLFVTNGVCMTIQKIVQKLVLLCSMLCVSRSAVCGDPFIYMQYDKAFDQQSLYEKHTDLMEKLGCACNVFPHNDKDMRMARPEELESIEQERKKFENDCLKKLNWERRSSFIKPFVYALANVGGTAVAVYAALYALSNRSIDSALTHSWGVNASGIASGVSASISGGRILESIVEAVESGKNFMYLPGNSMAELEERFAKNKCYIPRSLWPKIIREFREARWDSYSRTEHKVLLDFTLDFTIYKPKPPLNCAHNATVEEVKKELHRRIEAFFSNYQIPNNDQSREYIKINVSKFIDQLLENSIGEKDRKQAPRYIYFQGSFGVGKTHFAQMLSDWIEELIPGSVRFEDLVVNKPEELEGDYKTPGAFLNTLRNQLRQNKRGSVINLDEATWLNDMVSSSKRIFNGDKSKISTQYFGDDIELDLDLPPVLIIVSSNDGINDPALASRFDIVNFPFPKLSALVDHAQQVIKNSKMLENKKITPELLAAIRSWIQSLKREDQNFRYIAGNVEVFVLGHRRDKKLD